MLSYFSKRIGAKLAAMSVTGILFVVVMLVSVWIGDRSVAGGVDFVKKQLTISRDVVDAKASSRGMTVGMLQLRLARTPEEAKTATDYFASRHASFQNYLQAAQSSMSLQANKARVADSLTLGDQLVTAFNQLSDLIEPKVSSGSPARDRDEQAIQDRMMEISNKIGQLLDQCIDSAKQRANDADGELKDTQARAMTMTAIAGLLVMLVLGASAIFASKSVAQPIDRLTARMGRLAAGDLEAEIPMGGRGDEIGEMARAVEVFKSNGIKVREMSAQEAALQAKSANLQTSISSVVSAAVDGDFSRRIDKDYGDRDLNRFATSVNDLIASIDQGIRETRHVVAALAEGDLTEEMSGEFRGAFGELQRNLNAAMAGLRTALGEVKSAADAIQSGTGALRTAADNLSKRTEKQAASLEETSAALEEITSAVGNSTDRAMEASFMVDEARRSTEQSGNVVKEAVYAMRKIEQASGEISQIINVIDEIAFQTNLLALNAGVEAARAGEAGKGFAVVAQEVRELAQRSAGAAKDIKALINRSTGEVEAGVKLVIATGDALSLIESQVSKINNHVHSISTAAKEQSVGLAEVNTAINQMDQMTQQNAAMVEETTADTSRLADEVVSLSTMISHFKIDGLQSPGRSGALAATSGSLQLKRAV